MTLRPPGPAETYLSYPWPAGALFYRAGSAAYPKGHIPYRGGNARFSPLHAADPTDPSGTVQVPTLYGAMPPADHRRLWRYAGALSETVLHDVPTGGGGAVDYRNIEGTALFTVVPHRELNLADLTSVGLNKLTGVSNTDMIESGPLIYPVTQAWAQDIHAKHFDGITWMSRQHNPSRALIVFGDRVLASDLELTDTVPATEAMTWIEAVATALNILILNRP